MKTLECTEFLQYCLPRLRFRWAGFRKVHEQVCNRLIRRINEIGLSGFSSYKAYLDDHPEEWRIFDSMLQITISRFYRDRGVFDVLCSKILPSIARNILSSGGNALNCWSAGCCSGEEAYTMQILWKVRVVPAIHRDIPLRITATDINPDVLKRARKGCYSGSSLRDLPKELIQQAFEMTGKFYSVRKPFTESIDFKEQDIRVQLPEGIFHLILCRNLVLTYFEEALQREIIDRIVEKLCHGGIFVIGIHESLPKGAANIIQYDNIPCIFRKVD